MALPGTLSVVTGLPPAALITISMGLPVRADQSSMRLRTGQRASQRSFRTSVGSIPKPTVPGSSPLRSTTTSVFLISLDCGRPVPEAPWQSIPPIEILHASGREPFTAHSLISRACATRRRCTLATWPTQSTTVPGRHCAPVRQSMCLWLTLTSLHISWQSQENSVTTSSERNLRRPLQASAASSRARIVACSRRRPPGRQPRARSPSQRMMISGGANSSGKGRDPLSMP